MLKEKLAQLVRLSIFSDICVKDVERLNEGSVKRCPERAPFLFHSVVQLDIERKFVIVIREVNRVSIQPVNRGVFNPIIFESSIYVESIEFVDFMNESNMSMNSFVCLSTPDSFAPYSTQIQCR